MRYIVLLVSSLWIVLGSAFAGPAHVLITAGQSNTDGRTPNRELPACIKALASDTMGFTRGVYPYCRIARNEITGRFVPFWPQAVKDGCRNSWAYDAVVYYLLGQELQEEFYVIKWAVGGTSIAPNYKSAHGRYWSADPEWLAQTTSTAEGGKSLLLSLVQEIDVCIDRTLSKLPEGYQIDAFLWHQGESDRRHGKVYYANLKAVVDYVRAYLTRKTGHDYSRLPFIFGTVAHANKSYDAEVEAGMKRLAAEDPNAILIDMSGAGLLRDRLHFDAPSAEYLGRRMYEKLAGILKINK